jgi:hypothetical protein
MHLFASRKLETLDRPQQPRLLSQWLALQTVSEAKVLRTNREARTAVAESAADEAAEAEHSEATTHQALLSALMPS